ncbi:MAG: pyridoxamine 5'-phosphate oxidase [Gammaproteobacteria bacterium]|nr:pyridoxamine 5'-phosphate oxidase [Gammaproteobacteria bacterium]
MIETLSETNLLHDPFAMFQNWYADAQPGVQGDPTQMTLATADASGRPSARIVLLKELDSGGFVFYTNYSSRKGADLAANPQAALLWWWPHQGRQVRVEGSIEQVPDTVSDAYFASRPRDSQIGAWASEQSSALRDRASLEERVAQFEKRFDGQDVPRPPHWGGYRLRPDHFEFWQMGDARLHDRFGFDLDGGDWLVERLNP